MDLTIQETLDMFAAHALAAYIVDDEPDPKEVACAAYEYARAMMAERFRRNERGVPLSEVGKS
jgi:hypothetical protein